MERGMSAWSPRQAPVTAATARPWLLRMAVCVRLPALPPFPEVSARMEMLRLQFLAASPRQMLRDGYDRTRARAVGSSQCLAAPAAGPRAERRLSCLADT